MNVFSSTSIKGKSSKTATVECMKHPELNTNDLPLIGMFRTIQVAHSGVFGRVQTLAVNKPGLGNVALSLLKRLQ